MGKLAYDVRFLALKSDNQAKFFQMDMQSSGSFFSAFEYASSATGRRFQNPLWKITEFLFGWRLRQALVEVKQFGRKMVKESMHHDSGLQQSGSTPKEPHPSTAGLEASSDPAAGSLIGALISDIQQPDLIADSALNFLSAGIYLFPLMNSSLLMSNRTRHHSSGTHMDLLHADEKPGRHHQDQKRTFQRKNIYL